MIASTFVGAVWVLLVVVGGEPLIAALARLRVGEARGLAVILVWLRGLRVRRQEREDVAQDVVLEALRSWPTFEPEHENARGSEGGAFRAWINVLTVRAARAHYRRAYRRREVPAADPLGEATEDAALDPHAIAEALERLHGLGEDAALVLAVDLEGRAVEDVAAEIGIGVSTAYARRARALQRLARDGDDP